MTPDLRPSALTAGPETTNLRALIVRKACLSSAVQNEMLALHQRYFENVHPTRFEQDLAEKDWVILLRRRDTLVGFSTQRLLTIDHANQPHRFLFSGDTIVDRSCWREQLLAGCFGHLMLRLIREYGEDRLYWFLISKGYRTYRFLPVFFHRFCPRPDLPRQPDLEWLLTLVARAKYGAAFDQNRGLIIQDEQADRLRPALCDVPDARQHDPFVKFFLERNPGFYDGIELACLAEIRRDNLNRFGWRVIERTQPTWVE
jgi:hypothetical protein